MNDIEHGEFYAPQNLSDFDTSAFEGIFSDIKRFDQRHPDQNDPPPMALLRTMLKTPAMQAFFAWFISQNLNTELENYKRLTTDRLPSKLGEFNLINAYRTRQDQGRIKKQGHHPLTGREYQAALKYLDQQPEIKDVFFLLDAGTRGYWLALKNYLLSRPEVLSSMENDGSLYQKCENALAAIQNGIVTGAITEELLPIVAMAAERDTTLSLGKAVDAGIEISLTERSAFNSDSEAGILECPFKRAVRPLINTSFIGVDGLYAVDHEKSLVGGLARAIAYKLQNPTGGFAFTDSPDNPALK